MRMARARERGRREEGNAAALDYNSASSTPLRSTSRVAEVALVSIVVDSVYSRRFLFVPMNVARAREREREGGRKRRCPRL